MITHKHYLQNREIKSKIRTWYIWSFAMQVRPYADWYTIHMFQKPHHAMKTATFLQFLAPTSNTD